MPAAGTACRLRGPGAPECTVNSIHSRTRLARLDGPLKGRSSHVRPVSDTLGRRAGRGRAGPLPPRSAGYPSYLTRRDLSPGSANPNGRAGGRPCTPGGPAPHPVETCPPWARSPRPGGGRACCRPEHGARSLDALRPTRSSIVAEHGAHQGAWGKEAGKASPLRPVRLGAFFLGLRSPGRAPETPHSAPPRAVPKRPGHAKTEARPRPRRASRRACRFVRPSRTNLPVEGLSLNRSR